MDAIYEEKDDDSLFAKVKRNWKLSHSHDNATQSFGEFVVELFRIFNEESPIHERESIRNATLDWLERNVVNSSGFPSRAF